MENDDFSQTDYSDETSVGSHSILNSPRGAIRRTILSQVDECQWLQELKETYALLTGDDDPLAMSAPRIKPSMRLSKPLSTRVEADERCAECTLPYGTCVHTSKRVGGVLSIKQQREMRQKTEIDEEIDDVMGFIGGGAEVETALVEEEINIHEMKWKHLHIQVIDKIDNVRVGLSTPAPRGWHTCVDLGRNFIVLFGGLAYR